MNCIHSSAGPGVRISRHAGRSGATRRHARRRTASCSTTSGYRARRRKSVSVCRPEQPGASSRVKRSMDAYLYHVTGSTAACSARRRAGVLRQSDDGTNPPQVVKGPLGDAGISISPVEPGESTSSSASPGLPAARPASERSETAHAIGNEADRHVHLPRRRRRRRRRPVQEDEQLVHLDRRRSSAAGTQSVDGPSCAKASRGRGFGDVELLLARPRRPTPPSGPGSSRCRTATSTAPSTVGSSSSELATGGYGGLDYERAGRASSGLGELHERDRRRVPLGSVTDSAPSGSGSADDRHPARALPPEGRAGFPSALAPRLRGRDRHRERAGTCAGHGADGIMPPRDPGCPSSSAAGRVDPPRRRGVASLGTLESSTPA